jgi:hypothetical protein
MPRPMLRDSNDYLKLTLDDIIEQRFFDIAHYQILVGDM